MGSETKTRLAFVALSVAVGGMIAYHYWPSEVVQVKYRGDVSLRPFRCTEISESSVVKRVCYDRSNRYMLINLNGTYYHYCGIDSDTVSNLLSADLKGRFYNVNIKQRFDCRMHPVPSY